MTTPCGNNFHRRILTLEKNRIDADNMGYTSSNMMNLNGPLIRIFIGFLLAIIGCVLILQSPDLAQVSYALFLIAFILVSLAVITLCQE
jgi:hypothetical protein